MRGHFTRPSDATLLATAQVMRSGLPRYEPGPLAGTRALLLENGTTNLFTLNQSTGGETDLTGFTSVAGATVSRVGVFFEGAFAVRVVTGTGVAAGVQATVPVSAQGSYIARCHVRSAQSSNVRAWVRLNYTDATFDDSPTIAIPQTATTVWFPVVTPALTTNPAKTLATVALHVRRSLTLEDILFEVDALQLEARDYATSWQRGGAPRATEVVSLPALDVLSPTATTIEGWIFLHDAPGRPRALADTTHAAEGYAYTNRWNLGINGDGELVFVYWNGEALRALTNPTPIPVETWTHVAVSWSPSGARLYTNGVVVSSHTDRPLFAAPFPILSLGINGARTQAINGLMWSWRFTRRARSDGEVMAAFANVNTFEPGLYYDTSSDTSADTCFFPLDGTLELHAPFTHRYVPETDFLQPLVITATSTAPGYSAVNIHDYEFPLLPHRSTDTSLTNLTFDFGAGVNLAAIWVGLVNYQGGYLGMSWDGLTYTTVTDGVVFFPVDRGGSGYRKGWIPLSLTARFVRLTLPIQLVDHDAEYFETPLVLFAGETTGLRANRDWGTQFSVLTDTETSQAGGHSEVQIRGERYLQLQIRGMAHHGEGQEWFELLRLGAHQKFLWLNNLGKPEESGLFRHGSQSTWEEQWNPTISATFVEHVN